MHPAIHADRNLRELALSEARNALGANEPLPVFLQQECITANEYAAIAANPTYQQYVKEYKADLQENGFSFAAKSRVLAEDLLADIYRMAKDIDTPAAMRVKTLENLVEWGRLAPKATSVDVPGAGFSITINLPTASGATTTAIPVSPATTPATTVVDVTPKPFALSVLETEPPDPDTLAYYDAEADPA